MRTRFRVVGPLTDDSCCFTPQSAQSVSGLCPWAARRPIASLFLLKTRSSVKHGAAFRRTDIGSPITPNESGRNEIYVRPFDTASVTGSSSTGGQPISGKWMVSKDGGTTALWRRDGKELFYLSLDGKVMAVDVSTSGVFHAGVPKAVQGSRRRAFLGRLRGWQAIHHGGALRGKPGASADVLSRPQLAGGVEEMTLAAGTKLGSYVRAC